MSTGKHSAGFRWTIFWKMTLIGMAGLVGFLAIGGIGYWTASSLTDTSETAFDHLTQARIKYAETSARALEKESHAKMLGMLNSKLIELLQAVVDGPVRPELGYTAEKIIQQAKDLTTKAEIIRTAPGSERTIPGTNGLTLGDQIIGNFEDVAVLLEYELPELFELKTDSAEFAQKQGSIVVSLTGMYWFISKTLGELAENLSNEVNASRADLETVSKSADALTTDARASLQSASKSAYLGLIVTFVLTLAILGGLFSLFGYKIITPLKKTAAMAEELKLGRVDARLDVGRRSDEFGDMAIALNSFADNLQNEVVASLQAMAEGCLNVDVHPVDDHDLVRYALQKTASDMNDMLIELRQFSDQIANGSAQVSDSSQTLSNGATESASSLEEISASMNELTAQTKLNADNATQATRLVGEARHSAEDGSNLMKELVVAMDEINTSSRDISKIIKAIDEIAFQTNLLALNAAVEAARAGQHGKGFAVVAEEVRNLAARSAKAAQETAELIESSGKKVANGTGVAERTEQALGQIVGDVAKVSDLVAEIAAASNEQAEGIDQVNQGLSQIDRVTQQTTAIAEESAAAAEELSGLSDRLRQMLSRFQLRGNNATAAVAPRAASAPPAIAAADGWGMASSSPSEDFIDLDDNDFGRY